MCVTMITTMNPEQTEGEAFKLVRSRVVDGVRYFAPLINLGNGKRTDDGMDWMKLPKWWFKAGEEQTDEGNWRLKCHEQYYSGFHFFREESDAEEFLEEFGWSDVAHLVKVKYSEAVLEGLQETMDVIVANKYTITEYIRCYHEDEEV